MIDVAALDVLDAAIARQPRLSLATLPTPLEEAPHLSERLGIRLLVKRDDQTGLALGGNKARKLEFLIADALGRGFDSVVTTGGSQSNFARMTAAACRKYNLDCHLVLDRSVHPEEQGNMLLDALLGAEVHWVSTADPAEATAGMERVAALLRAAGKNPAIFPRGGSMPVGATGYTAMVPELLRQLAAEPALAPAALYLATGSAGTHAGTLAGVAAAGMPFPIRGVSVSRTRDLQEAKVFELAAATLEHLGLPIALHPDTVAVDDRFRGPGYGIPTDMTMEAIKLAARDDALLLDPVYTGKAFAGLIGHVREGRIAPGATIIFLHTGGAPALFAYNQEVIASLA